MWLDITMVLCLLILITVYFCTLQVLTPPPRTTHHTTSGITYCSDCNVKRVRVTLSLR